MSDGMFLGSEVIIMSVKDADILAMNLLSPKTRARLDELQQLGVLDILLDLESAVKRHEWYVPEVDDEW
jgi:hypothetical protein